MSLFEVNEYDKKYYESNIKNFIPDKMIDVHTHVYLEKPPRTGQARTVTWRRGWRPAIRLMTSMKVQVFFSPVKRISL